jgi:ABC-2 type transport system ATP-binding protein
VLAAWGVERSYGRRVALAPVDVALRAGEVVGVVGPNGAGKSTLLAILAGAMPASGGRVEQSSPPPRIGWVPQRPALYGPLSARENLRLFAQLARLPDADERVAAALDRWDLPGGGQPASQLSVGNQQRLNIALGLLGGPSVLLLDEPTASLDPAHRRVLFDEIRSLAAAGGTVLFATHAVEEVERLAARVIALDDSRLVFAGTPAELAVSLPELRAP